MRGRVQVDKDVREGEAGVGLWVGAMQHESIGIPGLLLGILGQEYMRKRNRVDERQRLAAASG